MKPPWMNDKDGEHEIENMPGGPPKKEPPKKDGDAGADLGAQVEAVLDAAEKAGELEPLHALVSEQGLDCSGRDLLKYAQDDDRTRGKKASELAEMLRNDPDLLDDIVASKEKDNQIEDGPSFEDVLRRKKAEPSDEDAAE